MGIRTVHTVQVVCEHGSVVMVYVNMHESVTPCRERVSVHRKQFVKLCVKILWRV